MSTSVDRWVDLFAKFLGNLQKADAVQVWCPDAHVIKVIKRLLFYNHEQEKKNLNHLTKQTNEKTFWSGALVSLVLLGPAS